MTVSELACYFHTTEKAIAGWRRRGYGPPWHLEDGEVVYLCDEIETWIDRQVEIARLSRAEKRAIAEAAELAKARSRADPAA
jgi:hypothetical protein